MEDGILCVVSLRYSFVPARDRAACEAAAERGPAPAGRRRAVACLHNMRTLAGAAWLAFLAALRAQAGVDWKPVNAEELCLKSPRVDKDAAAEIIFKEIRIEFKNGEEDVSEYARIKIFSDRGREQATVSVPYFDKDKIREASGRTTKPGGATQAIAADGIFDRTVIKANGHKIKVTSLTLPNVEAGDVIEYYWRAKKPLHAHERIEIQADIPSERVRVVFKNATPAIGVHWVFIDLPEPVQHFSDETSLEFTDLAGIHDEPLMPPEDMAHGWILFVCRGRFQESETDALSEYLKKYLKSGGDLRRTALEITRDAASDEGKLRNAYEYCQNRIKRVGEDPVVEDFVRGKQNHTPEDTLKRGIGTGSDIDALFVALARAAGFEARWTTVPDGEMVTYDRNAMEDMYFFRTHNVAVRVGGQWRFFDPATRQLPFGMLRWQEEGQPALIVDESTRSVELTHTPTTTASASACNHVGMLRLDADGTLEGDIHIGYTGHMALEKRQKMINQGEQQWQKNFTDDIRTRWKGADVSDLRIEKRDDPGKPLLVIMHLRIPGYASRTGKRLFLQPAIFQAGTAPVLAAKTRQQPVYFHYSWAEDDQYSIELPAGYLLDSADVPMPIVAEGLHMRYEVHASAGESKLAYRRSLSFGPGGWMIVPAEQYKGLKSAMDAVQKSDDHTIVLKQAAPGVSR